MDDVLPLLSLVRCPGWSVNPPETLPLLRNVVKTAGQYCHLSEEEKMRTGCCRKLSSVGMRPGSVRVAGRGGAGLSLKGLEVLDRSVAKQT